MDSRDGFKVFDPDDYDSETLAIMMRLPVPFEIKRLPTDEGWCIRVQLEDGPLAAIETTPRRCAERMLAIIQRIV